MANFNLNAFGVCDQRTAYAALAAAVVHQGITDRDITFLDSEWCKNLMELVDCASKVKGCDIVMDTSTVPRYNLC